MSRPTPFAPLDSCVQYRGYTIITRTSHYESFTMIGTGYTPAPRRLRRPSAPSGSLARSDRHASARTSPTSAGTPCSRRPPPPPGRARRGSRTPSERGRMVLGWPKKMHGGPCIPVGIQLNLETAEVGPTSGPTWRLSHFPCRWRAQGEAGAAKDRPVSEHGELVELGLPAAHGKFARCHHARVRSDRGTARENSLSD